VTRTLIEPAHPQLSVARQCALLGVARSSWYYTPHGERAENLELMRRMDEQYTQTPFYGIRRMTAWLRGKGIGSERCEGVGLGEEGEEDSISAGLSQWLQVEMGGA
jgi:hypothetical protein